MAMYDSEAFWQEFMRRPDAQKALKVEQKLMMKEQANELSKEYDSESAELKEELMKCSNEVKMYVGPIVKYQIVHRLLYNLLKDCRTHGTDFNEQLCSPTAVLPRQLKALHQEWKSDPQNLKSIEKKWTEICLEAKQTVTQESYKEKPYTWKDIPKEELAERLSKGEIMPRDEWIPGISKGKRKLDSASLKEHLTLGEQMKRDGRESFQNGDYEMALTRYTQGVELLNWVEGTNENDNHFVEEMYISHLRNQALAALKCEKYHQALKACNVIIQEIDPYDDRAHYRRGKAYSLLGMIVDAKNDFLFIIRSPHADQESILAAKGAMKELRGIVNKYKKTAKEILTKSLDDDTFSSGRGPVFVPEVVKPKRKSWFDDTMENIDTYNQDNNHKIIQENNQKINQENNHKLNHENNHKLNQQSNDKISNKENNQHIYQENNQNMHNQNINYQNRGNNQNKENKNQENNQNNSDKHQIIEPKLDLEQTRALLESLLEAYTSPDVQKVLNECRRKADFEERRILIRIGKYIHKIQLPIYTKFGLANTSNNFDYKDAKRDMERTVGYWRSRDEDVRELAKACWAELFGDCIDFDE